MGVEQEKYIDHIANIKDQKGASYCNYLKVKS